MLLYSQHQLWGALLYIGQSWNELLTSADQKPRDANLHQHLTATSMASHTEMPTFNTSQLPPWHHTPPTLSSHPGEGSLGSLHRHERVGQAQGRVRAGLRPLQHSAVSPCETSCLRPSGSMQILVAHNSTRQCDEADGHAERCSSLYSCRPIPQI